MDFLPSDIARLILGYLEKENCVKTFSQFLEECTDLAEFRNVLLKYPGRKISAGVMGLSLLDILKEYSQCKTLVQYYLLENEMDLRPTDSLVSQTQQVLSSRSKNVGDAFAEAVQQAISDQSPERRVSNAPVTYSKAKIQHSKVLPVTRAGSSRRTSPREIRSLINEQKLKSLGARNIRKPSVKPPPRLDVAVFYDQLLNNRMLHEKIADNINKAMQVDVPNVANEAGITDVIQTAIQQTESDPAFGDFLADLLNGLDTSVSSDISSFDAPDRGAVETNETGNVPNAVINPLSEKVSEVLLPEQAESVNISLTTEQYATPMVTYSAESVPVPSNELRGAENPPQQPQVQTNQPSQELPNVIHPEYQPLVVFCPEILPGLEPTPPQQPTLSFHEPYVAPVSTEAVISSSNAKRGTDFSKKHTKSSRNAQTAVRKYVPIAPKVTGNSVGMMLAQDDDLLPASAVATAFHSNVWIVGSAAQLSFDPSYLVPSPLPSDTNPEVQPVHTMATETPEASVSMPLLEASPNIKRLIELSTAAAAKLPNVNDAPQTVTEQPNPTNPTSLTKTPRSHVRVLAFSPEKTINIEDIKESEPGSQVNKEKGIKTRFMSRKAKVDSTTWDSQLRSSVLRPIPPTFQLLNKESHEEISLSKPNPVCKKSHPKKPIANTKTTKLAPVINAYTPVVTHDITISAPTNSEISPEVHLPAEITVTVSSPVATVSMAVPTVDTSSCNARFIAVTPVKAFDSTSSPTWMIPRTPEIHVNASNSTSPSLVSLTKGFQFLHPTVSPDRVATPDILGIGMTPSTPNTPIFPRESPHFRTPRLTTIQQEETSQLGTCDISPTQVIFRSSDYFVPSSGSEKKKRSARNIQAKTWTPEQINSDLGIYREISDQRRSVGKLATVATVIDKARNVKNTVRKLYEENTAKGNEEQITGGQEVTQVPTPQPELRLEYSPMSAENQEEELEIKMDVAVEVVEKENLVEKFADNVAEVVETEMLVQERDVHSVLSKSPGIRPSFVMLRSIPDMWKCEIRKRGYVDLYLRDMSASSWTSGRESVVSLTESRDSGDPNAVTPPQKRRTRRSRELTRSKDSQTPTVKILSAKSQTGEEQVSSSRKSRTRVAKSKGNLKRSSPERNLENVIQQHLEWVRSQIGLPEDAEGSCKECEDVCVDNAEGDRARSIITTGNSSSERQPSESVGRASFISSIRSRLSGKTAVLLTLNISAQ